MHPKTKVVSLASHADSHLQYDLRLRIQVLLVAALLHDVVLVAHDGDEQVEHDDIDEELEDREEQRHHVLVARALKLLLESGGGSGQSVVPGPSLRFGRHSG